MTNQHTEEQQTEIVIIGAGYAGLLATVRLAGKLRRKPATITLVNASDQFVERVRLHQFAANYTLKPRPITSILQGTGVNFVQGNVSRIDATQHTLDVQTETGAQHIHYDKLIYALGSTTNRDSVPGVRDYAYTLAPSGPLSAAELRERLPALNESGGRVVISGGGATGIEAAAEFGAAYPNLSVTLLTRGPFGQTFGKGITRYMRRSLERLGVTIQDHTAVTEITPTEIYTNSGTFPYDLCLWAGGFVAPPLARESGLAVNERGQILVDPFLHSVSHPDIMAVGDAASPVEDPGVKVRMSAFTALILGAHAADSLAATLQGKTPKPLSFTYLGQGIALGPHNGVGFGLTSDDRPKSYYFPGRTGYEIRELAVRTLAALPGIERRRPGFFVWLGKGRYAASLRRVQRSGAYQNS